MSDINIQLAREFFELNLFYVLPHWQFDTGTQDTEYLGSLLFVEQRSQIPLMEPGGLLRTGDIKGIQRAVVEVRAWHADRLYPSVIEANPVFARVASSQTRNLAETIFNGEEFKIILIVSEFSSVPARRDQAVSALCALGINHVLEFPTMLAEMVRVVSPQGSYAPSHTLQTIRLLKRYDFIRLQQLELFFPPPPPDAPVLPQEKVPAEDTFASFDTSEPEELSDEE